MQLRKRWAARLAIVAAAGGLLAGCGSASSASSSSGAAPKSSSAAPKSSALGTPHKATGKPIVLAMIDDVGGSLSAPEGYQGATAAVDYVNNYLDGVNGRPLKLDECSNTTNAPTASASCANQLMTDHPAVVLGGVDTGAPGALPVWSRNKLPYVGGLTFTPVESNASNAVIFSSISGADNAAMVAFAKTALHAKGMALVVADDTQDLRTAKLVNGVAKALGMPYTDIPLSITATASQFAAAAARAVATKAGFIYIESPDECPQAVLAIRQAGYTGPLAAIDSCASPASLATMGSSSNGLYLTSPYIGPNEIKSKQFGGEVATTLAALAKYAPKNVALDTVSFGDFGSVMNLRAVLDKLKGNFTESRVIGAFKTGSNHPNWLAHSYTCNGKQISIQTAVCNAYQQAFQVKQGKLTTLDNGAWISGAKYIRGS